MSTARAVMRKAGKTPSLYLCLLALIVWGPPSETAKEAIVLSCEECIAISKVLEIELAKQEPDTQPVDDLVGEIRPRRRMLHPRSEMQIFAVLDRLCEVVTTKLGEHYTVPCQRVIAQHRDALENGIYADGLEHTRHLLCMDVVPACGAHSLYDSGEL
ncbi:hypothetical protein CVIRNUC_002006 [Coccomyxa viridis]|uniref:Saposin B-type domain-containing protein n=1 Tax=Coccomyxa viridis TaxID=1274662 RepID=A0AAV1HY70_9CHLO|nr:hypothetical protein CVIRNUC_002006 [Coccomyxa viridis]